MQIEALENHHDLTAFDCGATSLNNYLQRTARKATNQNTGRTFVAVVDNVVVGYYTLVSATVSQSIVPEMATERFPVPVTLLACLAADKAYHGKGTIGPFLLKDALRKAFESSKLVASHAVTLDARDDRAKQFYLRYGFTELPDGEKHLFLPMKQIEKAIENIEVAN